MFFSKINGERVSFANNMWNPLLEIYEDYNSGIHTCVDSIINEIYDPFRKIVSRMGITSVDTEAFHIVQAQKYVKNKRVGFSGIYYATDYLRKMKEKDIFIPYDLTKKDKLRELSKKMLPIITKLLVEYLQNLTISPTD